MPKEEKSVPKPEPEPEIEHSIKPFESEPEPEIEIPIPQTDLNPEKHKTFLRLARPRTQKVLNSLKILGNCSNKSSYAYTAEEVDKIFTSIYAQIDATLEKFHQTTTEKTVFEF